MHHRSSVAVAILGLLAIGCGTDSAKPGSTAPGASASPATATSVSPPVELQPNGTELPGALLARTVSGKTRCVFNPAQVTCLVHGGFFPQAPPDPYRNGYQMASATVDVVGAIAWSPDPGEDPFPLASLSDDNFSILNYDQTYAADGWTIEPTEQGITITNDRTGHGMSISSDNADLKAF
jgi:hypothetical protein